MRFVHESPFIWRWAFLCVASFFWVCEARASESEDWIVAHSLSREFEVLETIKPVGRIETINAIETTFEEPTTGDLLGIERRAIRFVLIAIRSDADLPTLRNLFFNAKDETEDRIWLRNGDSFPGRLQDVDRRRVRFEGLGRIVDIPRWRVLAIRFGDSR